MNFASSPEPPALPRRRAPTSESRTLVNSVLRFTGSSLGLQLEGTCGFRFRRGSGFPLRIESQHCKHAERRPCVRGNSTKKHCKDLLKTQRRLEILMHRHRLHHHDALAYHRIHRFLFPMINNLIVKVIIALILEEPSHHPHEHRNRSEAWLSSRGSGRKFSPNAYSLQGMVSSPGPSVAGVGIGARGVGSRTQTGS